ncbi:patatin-like protein 3 [Humulus lupulus]|uniref:patatin-like protein 3 n=1 Tax=Humulus lupulus TaxID=3486 RepID=UPI002B41450F|nr:patatin-like protein 3 [Humulus lupulus]
MSNMAAETITVLSIDGGGVRGIIPGVILAYLESKLQEIAKKEKIEEDTWLADYFDVISGTSTGGLIATMISTPSDNGTRPLYEAKDIVPFYKRECPNIFSNKNNGSSEEDYNRIEVEAEQIPYGKVGKPTYGTYLQGLAKDILKEKRLSNTLTNVVIPAFDIKKFSPVIFSSYEVKSGNKVLDAKLADICISTSAAPTYLPAYNFENESEEFNMIDGGLAANNPTVAAITEAVKPRAKDVEQITFPDLLVISLGTGVEGMTGEYNAEMVNGWSAFEWIRHPLWSGKRTPIIDFFSSGNADMVDHYCTMFFQYTNNAQNFLRVQDNNLPKELSRLDNASTDNMDKLEKFAQTLLTKSVTRLNLSSFRRDLVEGETYEKALNRFAKLLVDIKKKRGGAA